MKTSIIEFPCNFTIKVMGPNTHIFTDEVLKAVHKTYGDLDANKVRSKLSKNKQYQSISLDIYATSQEQLDTIYRALHQVTGVQMLL